MKTKGFIIVKVGTGWQLTAMIEENDHIKERRDWITKDGISNEDENLMDKMAEYLDGVKNMEIW